MALFSVIFVPVLVGIVFGMVGFFTGYIVFVDFESGQKLHGGDPWFRPKPTIAKPAIQDILDTDIIAEITAMVNASQIHEYLRVMSEFPHMAGTPNDHRLAHIIKDIWETEGMETVQMVPYEVLLSYPNTDKPNKVQLIGENKSVAFESHHEEVELRHGDKSPDFVHAFNAYSPSGTAEASQLIYANYGRPEDFDRLESLNITTEGKLVIVRYGKIYRGNKVLNAQERGALGVIIYSDPTQVAATGTNAKLVYPNSWWMPDTAMQRGSTFLKGGDPLTPGWPSLKGTYRHNIDDVGMLNIPCIPIGYGDAEKFLQVLSGPEAFPDWSGGLNITYRLGPDLVNDSSIKSVKIISNNSYNQSVIYNVIGTIKGLEEPDRYVILGAHYDAWGYGAVDPGTGTSTMMETSRVFTRLLKEGKRPRRTVVFAAWSGEEFGKIGSIEWVEDHLPMIVERGVAYLNSDVCVGGNAFRVEASPVLKDLIIKVAQKIHSPLNETASLYDEWLDNYRKVQNDSNAQIGFDSVGSGSDFAGFALYAGIPSADSHFWVDKTVYKDLPIYPAYHTGYETFYLVDEIMDPGFKISKACSQVQTALVYSLSNNQILPLNPVGFANKVKEAYSFLNTSGALNRLAEKHIPIDLLERYIEEFSNASQQWSIRINKTDLSKLTELEVRALNDQAMKLDRIFIQPTGPLIWLYRHAVFSPSIYDAYHSKGFPVITDMLFLEKKLTNQEELRQHWDALALHVTKLIVMFRQATQFLQ